MTFAHMAGVPVEELLPLAYVGGGALLTLRAWAGTVTRSTLRLGDLRWYRLVKELLRPLGGPSPQRPGATRFPRSSER